VPDIVEYASGSGKGGGGYEGDIQQAEEPWFKVCPVLANVLKTID
jgi:hypothetical protein